MVNTKGRALFCVLYTHITSLNPLHNPISPILQMKKLVQSLTAE